MFDARIVSLAPFVPHPLEAVQRALPAGAIDAAMYDTIKKRYARITDQAIERMEYNVDGLRVTGAFVRPKTIAPQNHPLLIFNRGGTGDYGMLVLGVILRYMLPFAQQGYLVLGSNYRGNDGGEGHEEFGGADQQDVSALLDIGKQHPGWDGKNVFMLGGSRGGMMTYLAIKSGDPITAAATFGAPSDAWALAAHRPEMEAKIFAKRFAHYAAHREAEFTARSAIKWPETLASVPLLIMHGDADTTVLPGHSALLSDALRGLHSDFKSVIYAGGNHSLSTHMKAMIEETLGWFESHRH